MQLSFGLKFAPCVKKLKEVQKKARNFKFIWIGFFGQKHADIFKFPIFVENGVRNYESLKIMLFCQKREENNNPTKYSHCFTQSLGEKRRATVNLPCVKKRKIYAKKDA